MSFDVSHFGKVEPSTLVTSLYERDLGRYGRRGNRGRLSVMVYSSISDDRMDLISVLYRSVERLEY